jgi:drug/metabolite transporter (DMT)-like permease
MTFSVPLGLRYMLLSALGFSLMAAGVKQASHYNIPVLEIVAVRAIVSLLLSYIDVKRKKISIWGINKSLLLARGAVGSIALMCVYFAVSTLPLAEATLLQYTYPAFTAVLALLFLKEKIQFATIICISFSILGLIIMMLPNLNTDAALLPTISVTAALIGAFLSAIAYILVRKLSQVEDTSVIIFYFPLIALPSSLILLGNDFIIPDSKSLVLLIAIGIFTQIGQIGLTKAMAVETAGKAAAYSYVQVIFAIVLGIILFDNIPNTWTWMGGSLIIVGALFNALYKRK